MTIRDELTRLLGEMAALIASRELGAVDLYLLGGAALILFEERAGSTKDLDVVHERLRSSNEEAAAALVEAFGKASGRSPYLDPVAGGLPPLPLGWAGRAVRRASDSDALRIWSIGPEIQEEGNRRWTGPRPGADGRTDGRRWLIHSVRTPIPICVHRRSSAVSFLFSSVFSGC